MSDSIAHRLQALDWEAVGRALDDRGWARTTPLLAPAECAELIALWNDPRRFRSRVPMARFRFGEGEYRYFADPLPRLVRDLRTAAFARLAPVANRWMQALGDARRFRRGSASSPSSAPPRGRPDRHRSCCAMRPAAGTRCTRTCTATSCFRSS